MSDSQPPTNASEESLPDEGLPGPSPEERPHPDGRRNAQGIRIDPEAESTHQPRRAVLSALVTHEPGVLSRASGLFSRRRFNIESLTVGPTEDTDYARITLVVEESDPGVEQVRKQLEKLVPVIAVTELEDDAIRRELALIKVDADEPDKIGALTDMYGGKTVDTTSEAITVEITGSRQKIEGAVETFEQFGIREIVRTGTAALGRGADSTA